MDEPFQSLDIPLRIQLMDLTLDLIRKEPRLVIAVTHDPREAVYLGRRIILLNGGVLGVLFDESLDLSREERAYGSQAQGLMEARLLKVLAGGQNRRVPVRRSIPPAITPPGAHGEKPLTN